MFVSELIIINKSWERVRGKFSLALNVAYCPASSPPDWIQTASQLSSRSFWSLFVLRISCLSGHTSNMRSEVSCEADCLPQQLFFFSPPSYFPAESLIWMSIWVHLCDVYIYIYVLCRLLLVRSISKGGAGQCGNVSSSCHPTKLLQSF